jgi:hypothetical protein
MTIKLITHFCPNSGREVVYDALTVPRVGERVTLWANFAPHEPPQTFEVWQVDHVVNVRSGAANLPAASAGIIIVRVCPPGCGPKPTLGGPDG